MGHIQSETGHLPLVSHLSLLLHRTHRPDPGGHLPPRPLADPRRPCCHSRVPPQESRFPSSHPLASSNQVVYNWVCRCPVPLGTLVSALPPSSPPRAPYLWLRPWSIFFRALLTCWLSLTPVVFSLMPRRPASPPTCDLPVPDLSNPRPRAVVPSARVAPRPLAARRPPPPWRCTPGPHNRVNPAKIRPKLSLASPHPLRGAGWRGIVPPLIPHPQPVGEPLPAPIMGAPARRRPVA